MKRKVCLIGPSTLMVSLPSKWAAMNQVKKGDEVDVLEQGKELLISTSGASHEYAEKIEVDVSNMNERVVKWFLSGLHKSSGYDEISINYNNPKIVPVIEELTKDLFLGFAIIEQTTSKCVIKSISKDAETEFSTALRRAFLVTMSMADSCLETMKSGKLENLKELTALERTNNQLTNFCERILNKKGYDNNNICFRYVINWNLEKVCDEYKYICEYFSQNENKNLKISKDVFALFLRTNNFLKSYYELYYKFDFEKLNRLSEERKLIETEAIKLYNKKSEKEIILLNHLLSIIVRTADFSGSMIVINLKK